MGREYHGFGKEYNVGKRERGNNIIFPKMLRLLGRISRREDNQELKKWGWGRISRFNKNGDGESSCRELHRTPDTFFYNTTPSFMK